MAAHDRMLEQLAVHDEGGVLAAASSLLRHDADVRERDRRPLPGVARRRLAGSLARRA
jgi:hypothetical protein